MSDCAGSSQEKELAVYHLAWYARVFSVLKCVLRAVMCATVISSHLSCFCHCGCVLDAYSKRQAAIFTAPVSSRDCALLVIRARSVCTCYFRLLFRRSNVLSCELQWFREENKATVRWESALGRLKGAERCSQTKGSRLARAHWQPGFEFEYAREDSRNKSSVMKNNCGLSSMT